MNIDHDPEEQVDRSISHMLLVAGDMNGVFTWLRHKIINEIV